MQIVHEVDELVESCAYYLTTLIIGKNLTCGQRKSVDFGSKFFEVDQLYLSCLHDCSAVLLQFNLITFVLRTNHQTRPFCCTSLNYSFKQRRHLQPILKGFSDITLKGRSLKVALILLECCLDQQSMLHAYLT